MSQARPVADAQDSPRYWTVGRIAAAVAMVLAVAAALLYVRWEEWSRLAQDREAFAHPAEGMAPDAAARPTASESLLASFDTSSLTIPKDQIFSGGPGKDGIPSITDPVVIRPDEAEHLRAGDRVVGVTINGESRAYPIDILTFHECVNDKLGGVPIAVIYCPLCDSVSVVGRRLDGKTYEFGISGLLYNSNVLLYDRQDQALWSQVKLGAVSGPNAGRTLRHLGGWSLTSLGAWLAEHPDSTVISRETGHTRPYGHNVYADYFRTDRLMFPAEPRDERMPNKEPVVGVRLGEHAKAYPVEAVARAEGGVVTDTIDGKTITLRADRFNESVEVIEAPDDAAVVHTFWFAWHAMHPQTAVYEPDGQTPRAQGRAALTPATAQTSSAAGFSSNCLNVCRYSAATAPSSTRWSALSTALMTWPTVSSPSQLLIFKRLLAKDFARLLDERDEIDA